MGLTRPASGALYDLFQRDIGQQGNTLRRFFAESDDTLQNTTRVRKILPLHSSPRPASPQNTPESRGPIPTARCCSYPDVRLRPIPRHAIIPDGVLIRQKGGDNPAIAKIKSVTHTNGVR